MPRRPPSAARSRSWAARPRRRTRRVLRRFLREKAALVALAYLLMLVVATLTYQYWWRYGPTDTDFSHVLSGPVGDHWLGTDRLGRDIVARLFAGARRVAPGELPGGHDRALLVACRSVSSPATSVGRLDNFLMRMHGRHPSLPALVLALAIVAVLGPGLTNAIIAIGDRVHPALHPPGPGPDAGACGRRRSSRRRGRSARARAHPRARACAPQRRVAAHRAGVAGARLGLLVEAGLSFLGVGAPAAESELGRDAERRVREDLHRPVADGLPGRGYLARRCSRSTSWATACATPSASTPSAASARDAPASRRS